MTITDLLATPAPPERVDVSDGWASLKVYPGGNTYDIELKRIKTALNLVEWLLHLAGKPWCDRALLKEFVRKVCVFKGWPLKR